MHGEHRVGQGLFWWQFCPAKKALPAGFWQGFPWQMYAKVLPTVSMCRVSSLRLGGAARAVTSWVSIISFKLHHTSCHASTSCAQP